MFVVCDCTGLDRADVYAKYGRCCKELKIFKELEQLAELQMMTDNMYREMDLDPIEERKKYDEKYPPL